MLNLSCILTIFYYLCDPLSKNYNFRAVVVPQSVGSGESLFSITVDGVTVGQFMHESLKADDTFRCKDRSYRVRCSLMIV